MFTASRPRFRRALPPLLAVVLLALIGLAPLPLKAAPPSLSLEFSGGDGGIVGSGLTEVLPGTTLNTSRLNISSGALVVAAGPGDLVSSPPQENAAGVAYVSRESYSIGARILGPQPFKGAAQRGGIFIGQNLRNYIRLTVAGDGSAANSGVLQLHVVDNGKQRTLTVPLSAGTLTGAAQSLDLFLTVEHGSNRVTALYRVNSDALTTPVQAITRSLPRWMRVKGNQSVSVLGGVITSSPAAQPIEVRYDWLRVLTTPLQGAVSGFKDVDKDGVDAPVAPGDQLTYTLGITNNGADGSFRIVDPLPPGTAYVPGSLTSSRPGQGFSAETGSVVWEGVLNSGASVTLSFAVTVSQGALQSATISNIASAVRLGSGLPATVLGATTTISGTPDLSDSSYSVTPASVASGETLTYTLVVTNDGTTGATGATAQLSIPPDAAYVPDSATASSGSVVISTALRQILWSAAGPLAPGATATVSFKATVAGGLPGGAAITSAATIDSAETLPVALAATATSTVPVTFSGAKQVDRLEASPGDALTYSFSVSNSGAPTELELLDPLPADVTFVALGEPSAGAATYDAAARHVRWSGSLGTGETAAFSVTVQVRATGLEQPRVVNVATLRNVAGGPAVLLSATTALTGVPSAAGSTYIAAPLTVADDGVATFALNVYNGGSAPATGASAELIIPAGMSYVTGSVTASSGTASYNAATGRVVWSSGGPLAEGGVAQVIFQARVTAPLQAGQLLSSVATVQVDGAAPLALSARVEAEGRVGPAGVQIYLPLLRR